jgi:predicted nucleic acid-binding protein
MTGSPPAPVWNVVLDANVLLQAPIRDTLLRLAEVNVLGVFWSEGILAEVARNFAAVTGAENASERWARLLIAMQGSFPSATVRGYQGLLPTLPITPHDRHVLASAIVASASIIVSYNTRHFPSHLLAPYGVRVWHPDTLLSDLLRQRPAELRSVLLRQGQSLRPSRTLAQVLDRLAGDAPKFAAQARQHFGLS